LRYGYRSIGLQLADPLRRFSLVLLDDFLPANAREENPSAALLLQLSHFYPDLKLDVVAGDAGLGYYSFLHAAYQLGAKRVVDLRSSPSDERKSEWPVRGYDDQGRPVCPFGYALTANGFDAHRQRHKWFCGWLTDKSQGSGSSNKSAKRVYYPEHHIQEDSNGKPASTVSYISSSVRPT
jgi:hypothetical protein